MKPLLVSLLSLTFVACVGPGQATRNFTVSGGKIVPLPFAAGGALPAETRDVKIEVAGFVVDAKKAELSYCFGFTEKFGKTPMRVVVEDVTGPVAVVLATDLFPSVDPAGYWKGTSSPREAGDESLAWLNEPGATEKVFRFTITLNDGRVIEVYQASVWSAASKPVIKRTLKWDEA